MSNRASRRKVTQSEAGAVAVALGHQIFFQLLDQATSRLGISRARIEEIANDSLPTSEEIQKLANCLIFMTQLALPERKTK